MKVGELAEQLAKRNESRFLARLGDFKVADNCSTLTIEGGEDTPTRQYPIDEKATAVLAKYLKLPVPYVNNCPPDFRAQTLRYWLNLKPGADTVVEAVDGNLVSLFPTGLSMLPVRQVAQMVEQVFEPDAEIHQLIRDEKRFHLDVTSQAYQVDVPNPNRIPGRPEVGDITCGGVRFVSHPNRIKAPSVSRFFQRVVCTNGMCTTEADGRISIKGLTVSEIIDSMEEAARELLGDMPDKLEAYKHTAEMIVPGHPVSFAEQLGNELGVPQRVLHSILDSVRQLPEGGTSVYDVNQAFTYAAHGVRNYETRNRLQTIGGALALDAHRMVERCTKCERLLVE